MLLRKYFVQIDAEIQEFRINGYISYKTQFSKSDTKEIENLLSPIPIK